MTSTETLRQIITGTAADLVPGDIVLNEDGTRRFAAFDTDRVEDDVRCYTAVSDHERGVDPLVTLYADEPVIISRRPGGPAVTVTELPTIYEFEGRDDYGRKTRTVYAQRPGASYGQVAIITVLPVAIRNARGQEGCRHMVTDRRIEIPFDPKYLPPVVRGLAAARAEAARLAALPVGTR
jgi:hypothetical protein